MKKWKSIFTAGTLTLGILTQAVPVMASDGIVKNGNYHIDQFGKYDIFVDVEVRDDQIFHVEVRGENFNGTYAETNEEKLSQASEKMTEKLIGISALDAAKIMETDTVSGATVSSDGIKRAVLNALNLTEKSDAAGALQKVPEAGEYEVEVSVKSDVVEHSLVEKEKAAAKLNVGEDGKIQLSYRMVSGTDKEPMYILAFHGYYPNNNRTENVTMQDASIETETKNGYTTVTEVSFPLCDLSGTYYVNSRIYVPAMSNLNGSVSGIQFENGTFDVDNVVTVYWDTLRKTSKEATNNMEIMATVEKATDSPAYSVVIPSAVSMGNINASKDNIMEYEITVRKGEEDGKVTVSAPETGNLTKKEDTGRKKEALKFTNDFGKQTIDGKTSQKESGTSAENVLKGRILIAAGDVKNASAGIYSGTTVFTINYEKGSGEDTDKKPDATTKIDVKNLADGVYSVRGNMIKVDKVTASMSDSAINHTIKLTVKNGKYDITLNLNGMTVGQKLGYLSQLKYFTTGYTLDQYGNPQGTLADVTVDSYQKNSDGSIVSDQYGTNYPDEVTFELIPEARNDGYVPLQVFVPIMDAISSGTGTQPVFLKLDWTSLKATTPDDPDFDKNDNSGNNNNNNGGLGNSGLIGNGGIGNNKLGTSSLGTSSLGKGTSGLGSSLKSAVSVKTGDIITDNTLWAALFLLGGVALLAGIIEYRKRKVTK